MRTLFVTLLTAVCAGLIAGPALALPGVVLGEQKISDTVGGFTGVLDDGDAFGTGAASLGDLDGDGVGDIAVGAPNDDDGGTNRGAIWILFLNADGTVKSHQKISDTVGGFTGVLDDNDFFGTSIVSLGDLDGDSVVDLAVGAYGDDDGGSGRGAAWILFLNANGTVTTHAKISSTAGGFGSGLDDSDNFGFSVGSLGDLDGDGTVDLAVGAYGDDDGLSGAGAVWVVFLDTDGTVQGKQKISATAGGLVGPLSPAAGRFGNAVAGIGDLDGDGVEDLVVGENASTSSGSQRGAAWILLLNTNGTVKDEQLITSATGGFTGTLDTFDNFGFSVASLGDVDADGIGDVAVGATGDGDGGAFRGAVWILFLNTDGTVKGHRKISDTAGNFGGVLEFLGGFGRATSLLGDLDGDGLVEVGISAPGDDDGGTDRGAVWIVSLDDSPQTVDTAYLATRITGYTGEIAIQSGDLVYTAVLGQDTSPIVTFSAPPSLSSRGAVAAKAQASLDQLAGSPVVDVIVRQRPGGPVETPVSAGAPTANGDPILTLGAPTLSDGGSLVFGATVCPTEFAGSAIQCVGAATPAQAIGKSTGGVHRLALQTGDPMADDTPSVLVEELPIVVGNPSGGYAALARNATGAPVSNCPVGQTGYTDERIVYERNGNPLIYDGTTAIATRCLGTLVDIAGEPAGAIYSDLTDVAFSANYNQGHTIAWASKISNSGGSYSGATLYARSLSDYSYQLAGQWQEVIDKVIDRSASANDGFQLSPQAVNFHRDVAYRYFTPTISGVVFYDWDTDQQIQLATVGDPIGSLGPAGYGIPAMNDQGEIALIAVSGSGSAVLLWEPQTERLRIVAEYTTAQVTSLEQELAINNRSEIAVIRRGVGGVPGNDDVVVFRPTFASIAVELLSIEDPGNVDDSTGVGAVTELFSIGRTEVANELWSAMLNELHPSEQNKGLFSTSMESSGYGGIDESPGPVYSPKPNFANKPVNFVTWRDTLRAVNWLDGPTLDVQGNVTRPSTEVGYDLLGSQAVATVRDPDAVWWLPTIDEWYKSAFQDPYSPEYWKAPVAGATTSAISGAACDAQGDVASAPPRLNIDYSCNWNGQFGNVATVGGTNTPSAWGVLDAGGNVQEWVASIDTSPLAGPMHPGAGAQDNSIELQPASQILGSPEGESLSTRGMRLARRPIEALPFDSGPVPFAGPDHFFFFPLDSIPDNGLLWVEAEYDQLQGGSAQLFLESCQGGRPVAAYSLPDQIHPPFLQSEVPALFLPDIEYTGRRIVLPIYHYYPTAAHRRGAVCTFRSFGTGDVRVTAEAKLYAPLGSLNITPSEANQGLEVVTEVVYFTKNIPQNAGWYASFSRTPSAGSCTAIEEIDGSTSMSFVPLSQPPAATCCVWTYTDPETSSVYRSQMVVQYDPQAVVDADYDADVFVDLCDNCVVDPNTPQLDADGDLFGNDCDPDDDNDGLLDGVETNTGIYVSPSDTGTNPLLADTDGDGFDDDVEIAAGTDPNNPASFPAAHVPSLSPPSLGVLVLLLLFFGGRSGLRTRRRD